MSSRIVSAAVVLACTALAACRIEPTPRVDGDDPANVARAEIELSLRNYEESLIDGDARRAAALFMPGAQLYLPETPGITGRGEIDRALAERMLDERIIDIDMQFESIDVAAGVASQFGTLQQRVRDAEGAEHDVNGRFAIRWVRAADSAWRIDRLLLNYAAADSVAQDTSTMSPDS